MIRVNRNGVTLIPGIDYIIDRTHINFTQAPHYGDRIQVATPTLSTNFFGNDVSYRFAFPPELRREEELQSLIADLSKYMDHPSVKDQLERLRVVIELVRNHPDTGKLT